MIALRGYISAEGWSPEQIISLVISIVSVIVAIVPTIVTSALSYRAARNSLYANTVSHARIEWVESIRELVAELAAFCARHETLNENECGEFNGEFEKIKTDILLRLSTMNEVLNYQQKSWAEAVEYGVDSNGNKLCTDHKGRYACDGDLIDLLNSDYSTVRANIDKIVKLTTAICKAEWNSIKAESGCRDAAEIKQAMEKYKKREEAYYNKTYKKSGDK